MEYGTVDRDFLRTDAGRAVVSDLWLRGIKQRDIGDAFGRKGGSTICTAIVQFIEKFCPDLCNTEKRGSAPATAYGSGRKLIVRVAISRYLRAKVARPMLFPKTERLQNQTFSEAVSSGGRFRRAAWHPAMLTMPPFATAVPGNPDLTEDDKQASDWIVEREI